MGHICREKRTIPSPPHAAVTLLAPSPPDIARLHAHSLATLLLRANTIVARAIILVTSSSQAQFNKPRNTVVAGAICDSEDARTMLTSCFDTTTNLRSDAFLAGKGGDFDGDDDDGNNEHKDDNNETVNEDNDKDTNCEDNNDLIF